MRLRSGYNISDYHHDTYTVEDDEGEALIEVSIDNVKIDDGRGSGYGVEIILEGGKIKSFRIRSYDIEVEIPATIEMHNKIRKLLRED